MHVCVSAQCEAHTGREKEGGRGVCGLFVLLFCVCVTGFSPSSIHPHPQESMCSVCGVCMVMQSAQQQVKRSEERRRREEEESSQSTKTKEQKEREQSERSKHKKTENRKTTVRLLCVSQCRRHSIGGAALLLSATFRPTGSRPLSSRLDRGS